MPAQRWTGLDDTGWETETGRLRVISKAAACKVGPVLARQCSPSSLGVWWRVWCANRQWVFCKLVDKGWVMCDECTCQDQDDKGDEGRMHSSPHCHPVMCPTQRSSGKVSVGVGVGIIIVIVIGIGTASELSMSMSMSKPASIPTEVDAMAAVHVPPII